MRLFKEELAKQSLTQIVAALQILVILVHPILVHAVPVDLEMPDQYNEYQTSDGIWHMDFSFQSDLPGLDLNTGADGSGFERFLNADFTSWNQSISDFSWARDQHLFDPTGHVKLGNCEYQVHLSEQGLNFERPGYSFKIPIEGLIHQDRAQPIQDYLKKELVDTVSSNQSLEEKLNRLRTVRSEIDFSDFEAIDRDKLKEFYESPEALDQEIHRLSQSYGELKDKIASQVSSAKNHYQETVNRIEESAAEVERIAANLHLEMPELTAEFEQQLADLGRLDTETGIDEPLPPQKTEVPPPQLVTIEEISERVRKLQNERQELDSEHFSAELKNMENQLISLKPEGQAEKTSKEFGIVSVTEARHAFDQGQTETATFFKDLAQEFLDLAMGLNPVTGLAQSVYELMVGESYLTGVELGKFDRAVAFLGIVTAGGGRSAIKAVQGMAKLAKGLTRFIKAKRLKEAEDAIELGTKISNSAGRTGTLDAEKIAKTFVEKTASEESKNVFSKLLSNAKRTTDKQMESVLEDGAKVVFRRDVGTNAHGLPGKYRDQGKIDHFNIEIQVPNSRGKFEVKENIHLIIDEQFNVIDLIK